MLFGKRLKFSEIAREDAEEENSGKGDGASFAPTISVEGRRNSGGTPSDPERRRASAPAPVQRSGVGQGLTVVGSPRGARVEEIGGDVAGMPDDMDFDDDAPAADGAEEERDLSEEDLPLLSHEEVSGEEPGDAPAFDGGASGDPQTRGGSESAPEGAADPDGEEPASDDGAQAQGELFGELCALPVRGRVYGVYGRDLFLSSPDGRGGVYLFDFEGRCRQVEAADCTAFVRLCGAEGWFRGKHCRTDDLDYLLDEKTFPLSFVAKNKNQYDLAMEDGYLPYARTAGGKGIKMLKPLSLYRMKDLLLRVEYAEGRSVSDSEEYLLDVDRAFFEGPVGQAQILRVGRACVDAIAAETQPFYTVQVQKVRRNLAVCFPMDGKPAIGDHLGGERITDMAPTGDGTLILRLGGDESVVPDLKEGTIVRGQHRICPVK